MVLHPNIHGSLGVNLWLALSTCTNFTWNLAQRLLVGVIVFEFWHFGKISHITFQKDVLYVSFSFVTFVTQKSCSVTWSACKGHCNMKCMLAGCREHDRVLAKWRRLPLQSQWIFLSSRSYLTLRLDVVTCLLRPTVRWHLPFQVQICHATLAKLLMKLMYSLRDTNTSPYTQSQ